MYEPATSDELQQWMQTADRIRVRGGGTKSALSAHANLSLSRLQGILEYEPSEYTFTALAGTKLADVQAALAENGQFLPFDPPLVESGATLGGTVASGLSGPGRFRFGGVRDFLLGVRLISGEGRWVFGGGKVVKNAAGFDIPKLMIGSLGQLAVFVELTFKVFPQPESWTTLKASFADFEAAVTAMNRLAVSQEELFCLDMEPPCHLWLRLGGLAEARDARIGRVQQLLPAADIVGLHDRDDARVWRDAGEFRWLPTDHRLVKLPISPPQIGELESLLAAGAVPRRYSLAGNLAWIGWPPDCGEGDFHRICDTLRRPGLGLIGPWSRPLYDPSPANVFADRLRSVFDPGDKLCLEPSRANP